jgi:transcription initiation factor IIE alpha subunit
MRKNEYYWHSKPSKLQDQQQSKKKYRILKKVRRKQQNEKNKHLTFNKHEWKLS